MAKYLLVLGTDVAVDVDKVDAVHIDSDDDVIVTVGKDEYQIVGGMTFEQVVAAINQKRF